MTDLRSDEPARFGRRRRVLGYAMAVASGVLVIGVIVELVTGSTTFWGVVGDLLVIALGVYVARRELSPPAPARRLREPTPEQRRAIDAELARGRRIEAVALYRQATGASLRDAKHAIDGWPADD